MVTDPPHSGLPPGIATSTTSRVPLCRGLSKCSRSKAMRLLRSRAPTGFGSNLVLALNRGAHQVAPLGPRTVVVTHVVVAEQVGKHEPGVGGPLAYSAVGYDIVFP